MATIHRPAPPKVLRPLVCRLGTCTLLHFQACQARTFPNQVLQTLGEAMNKLTPEDWLTIGAALFVAALPFILLILAAVTP